MLSSFKSRFSSGMVVLITLLWALQFSSVNTTISPRYGGAIRRPVHKPYLGQPGQAFPSPTHSYPIFHRPQPHQPFRGVRFPEVVQQYTPAITNGFAPITRPHQSLQAQPQAPIGHQTVFYPNYQQQQYFGRPQQMSYQTSGTSTSYQQPAAFNPVYGQSSTSYGTVGQLQSQASNTYNSYPSYSSPMYGNQAPIYTLGSSGSSSYGTSYPYNTGSSYGSQQASSNVHFHTTSTKLVQDGTSPSVTTLSEPCTNNHWKPIGSSSVSTASASSQQPTYFYGGSIATATRPSVAPAYFRYQPESSHKVVVLSHDVLKTLLANTKSPQSTSNKGEASQGVVDNVASQSIVSPTTVVSGSNALTTSSAGSDDEQPSVKLIGYIAPASEDTPTGYIQVPISKQMMETLSGAGSNYDFAVNSSKYSLFTLKSVNDVDSLFGLMKSNDDLDASASINVPLGLVVKGGEKEELKSAASSNSDIILYPVESSGSSSSGASGGAPGSIQMVGHVQITSPDISTHFNKRVDQASTS